MIACFYGRKTDVSTLRSSFQVSLKGTTLQDLITFADQLGFASRPLRLEPPLLNKLHAPAILHWEMNHFVVLVRAGRRHVTIHDPGRGRLKLSFPQVAKLFTGVALELHPSPNFEEREDIKPVRLTDFWSRISGLKRSMVQAFLLSAFLQVFALLGPLYQQMVVDEAITKQDEDFLAVLAMGFGLMGVIGIAVAYLRSQVMLHFSSALNFQMKVNLFRHLVRLPMEFFERRHIGDISSRFGSLNPIAQLFTSGVVAIILDGLMAVGTVALAFAYSAKLTLLILAFLALGLLIEWLAFPARKRMNEEILHLAAREDSSFLETMRAARAIKIFGQETNRASAWQNLSADTLNANVVLAKFNINLGSLTGLIGVAQSVLTLYIGAMFVVEGSMTLGMLFAYQSYAAQFSGRISALIGQVISLRMLKLHLERLADIVHTKPEVPPGISTGMPAIKRMRGRIGATNIRFRYGVQEPWVLNGVDLNVGAGEMVAIAGASGGGKSTLLKVLVGLLHPQEGEVRVDGVPLSVIGPQAFRSSIGVVMQDDQLLSGSIAENISFFDVNPNMERVEECARSAWIHEDILNNPMGYNSLIGDMGTTLSGGQKQRILIARARYRKPRMLFLDEGTANLDEANESGVARTIAGLGITRLVIAHRPALMDIADRTIELREGLLCEAVRERRTR